MSVFKITDLEYRYANSSVPALHDVNINLDAGQCLGLIGPNGAGKSTLLSILSGLLIPTSGTLHFDQNTQATLSKFVQKNVALVPQEYAFYPQLSVVQNLQYFVSLCGLSSIDGKTKVHSVMQQCQLQQVSTKKAKRLSGGYKRRLNLAIALLKDPQILYLDEPTVGVDPISRTAILALLKTLKNQGKTIVYTSHMLTEVQDICDQIVMLTQGKASYLSLNTQQKFITITFAKSLSANLTKQLHALPIKVECKEAQVTAFIESPEELLTMLTLLGNSQLAILNIHYDQTSLTQYYLNHMEENDSTEY
ncbi:MAG: ABC transporter ATP-binding protein [Paraglaciecola sp.]|uniref:ABC transporter ATP-binding protein n=1 Tax=Paraglaciecola sp. TaxID=1920173 RepID=UPI003299B954